MERVDITCNRNHCGGCCQGHCSGCGMLELTQEEEGFLLTFAELPFQPLVSKSGSEVPVYAYLEELDETNVRPDVIQALAVKGLIQVDYKIPLNNYEYQGFEDYPIHGSMALTYSGQLIIDELFYRGIRIRD